MPDAIMAAIAVATALGGFLVGVWRAGRREAEREARVTLALEKNETKAAAAKEKATSAAAAAEEVARRATKLELGAAVQGAEYRGLLAAVSRVEGAMDRGFEKVWQGLEEIRSRIPAKPAP